jgi:hypothetical protein
MPPTTIDTVAEVSAEQHEARGRSSSASPAMWWAIAGVALLFATAALRLGGRGVTAVAGGLDPLQWLALITLTAAFVYGEGIRALQRKYVPHVIRRVELLRDERRVWYRIAAPLHALTLIGAPAGALLRAWGGTAAILAAVLIVRGFPEPWRGIIGFAVSAALAWGTYALLRAALRAFRQTGAQPLRSANRTTRSISAETVMGPIPPGTGESADRCAAPPVRSTSPTPPVLK